MRRRPQRSSAVLAMTLIALVAAGCGAMPGSSGSGPIGEVVPQPTPRPQAISLLGQPLFAPEPSPEARAMMERQLADARAAYDRAPENADALIWLGRRLAYLGEYRAAIDVFTEGVRQHPRDARMYRHRGHRFITTRQFDRAVSDLETAASLIEGTVDQVEPDGQPNRFNIPVSTLHTNIWYHLALAHYLRHDFEAALPAWRTAIAASTNDDMLVASSDWLYMTLRRLGDEENAARVLEPIRADMNVLENTAYHRRLLVYKGVLPADSLAIDTSDPVQLATYGYGLANWYFYNGDRARARALFRRILDGSNWAAFGYIAAEAELADRPR